MSLTRPVTESRSSIAVDDATVLSDDRLEAGQQGQPHRLDHAEPAGRLRFPVQPVARVAHAHEYRYDQPALAVFRRLLQQYGSPLHAQDPLAGDADLLEHLLSGFVLDGPVIVEVAGDATPVVRVTAHAAAALQQENLAPTHDDRVQHRCVADVGVVDLPGPRDELRLGRHDRIDRPTLSSSGPAKSDGVRAPVTPRLVLAPLRRDGVPGSTRFVAGGARV